MLASGDGEKPPKVSGFSGAEDKKARRNKNLGLQILEVVQLVSEVILLIAQVIYYTGECIYKIFVPTEPKSVKGEVVLITGIGHGIGRELALLYASEGATIVGWDINEKGSQETREEAELRNGPNIKFHTYLCDVSNRQNVLDVAKNVTRDVGDVTVLINNAGIMPTHPLLEQTQQEIEKTYGVNVLAHCWTIQAFLPSMLKNNKGHIVCLSSVAGLFGLENIVPYCGTKFAVRGMMEALNEELRLDRKCKVELTTICPYMADTGLCKKPRIKFEKLMPLLCPKTVATYIMEAQRKNVKIASIPKFLYYVNNYARLLPVKAGYCVKDFLNSGVDSDL